MVHLFINRVHLFNIDPGGAKESGEWEEGEVLELIKMENERNGIWRGGKGGASTK